MSLNRFDLKYNPESIYYEREDEIERDKNGKKVSKKFTYAFKRMLLARVYLQQESIEQISYDSCVGPASIGRIKEDRNSEFGEIRKLADKVFKYGDSTALSILALSVLTAYANERPEKYKTPNHKVRQRQALSNKNNYQAPAVSPSQTEQTTMTQMISSAPIEPQKQKNNSSFIPHPTASSFSENIEILIAMVKDEIETMTGVSHLDLEIKVTSDSFMQQMVLTSK